MRTRHDLRFGLENLLRRRQPLCQRRRLHGWNLLGNAHKFSPPGEPIEVLVAGGAVVVRDHGEGIAVEDRERIFDRFYRSTHTRTMPGSGLGLAIVSQIVTRHGGSVWVGDGPGGGAEVGFRLPAVHTQAG